MSRAAFIPGRVVVDWPDRPCACGAQSGGGRWRLKSQLVCWCRSGALPSLPHELSRAANLGHIPAPGSASKGRDDFVGRSIPAEDEGNGLPRILPVNGEVAVEGQDPRRGVLFGHSNQTSVSQRHRHVVIATDQLANRLQLRGQVERRDHKAAFEELQEGWDTVSQAPEQEHRLTDDSVAGEERRVESSKLCFRPIVVLIVPAQIGDEWAGVDNHRFHVPYAARCCLLRARSPGPPRTPPQRSRLRSYRLAVVGCSVPTNCRFNISRTICGTVLPLALARADSPLLRRSGIRIVSVLMTHVTCRICTEQATSNSTAFTCRRVAVGLPCRPCRAAAQSEGGRLRRRSAPGRRSETVSSSAGMARGCPLGRNESGDSTGAPSPHSKTWRLAQRLSCASVIDRAFASFLRNTTYPARLDGRGKKGPEDGGRDV